jgi:hypothetical protein
VRADVARTTRHHPRHRGESNVEADAGEKANPEKDCEYETARALPGAEQFPEETFTAMVAILTNTFDGAAIVRAVMPQPELEDKRIELLTALLSGASTTRQD